MKRLWIVDCGLWIEELRRGLRPARPLVRWATFLFGLVFLSTIPGCGEGATKKPEPDAATKAISRTATDGPVKLTLTVSPAELPYTDRASVIVDVLADANVTVELADYDRDKTHLEHQYEYRLIREERRAAVPTSDGKLSWRFQYGVQFFAPGEFEFPPAKLTFAGAFSSDAAGAPESDNRELTTEGVSVHARDPNAKPLSPDELRKLTSLPPVELPRPWSRAWWITTAIVAALAFTLWFMRRRESAQIAPAVIPAHEWARRMLAQLIAEDLVPRGMIQEFYYRVSDIVRGYVERRFGVSAPEMTTEEFLTTAAGDGRFGARHTTDLRGFLTACDLVKYARQIPAASEADQVLQAAKSFIDRTKPDPAAENQAP